MIALVLVTSPPARTFIVPVPKSPTRRKPLFCQVESAPVMVAVPFPAEPTALVKAAGGSGGLVRVPRPGGSAPLVVMVAPLSLAEGVETGARPRGTLFVVHDPLNRTPATPQHLAEIFNLPLGAATMLAAMATGEEAKHYAARAGISMNTVRFHLKSAYARIGVRRQAELIRRVTAALRDLADHRDRS